VNMFVEVYNEIAIQMSERSSIVGWFNHDMCHKVTNRRGLLETAELVKTNSISSLRFTKVRLMVEPAGLCCS